MANHVIEINVFDSSSIDKAIKELKQIQKKLDEGCKTLVELLADIGVKKAQANFDVAIYAGDNAEVKVTSKISKNGKTYIATVSANGENVGFIEFGTGINFEFPYSDMPDYETSIPMHGTYGKLQGANPYGWWYKGSPNGNMPLGTEQAVRYTKKYGEVIKKGTMHTYGNPANSSMHNAYMELQNEISRCVKEAFKL